MGPIEKKIDTILKHTKLSNETMMVLESLKLEIQDLERSNLNNAYFQGFSDKERGQSPTWDYHSHKYRDYITSFKVGSIN
jgi:hypothetical protein